MRKALPFVNLGVKNNCSGMQRISFTQYFSELINDEDVLKIPGAIGRLHKYKSALTVEQLMEPFKCKHGEKWKVYDRKSMATRKHYQNTLRVGDVIVQGEPGTRFYQNSLLKRNLTGDHGYDYINPSMHTIFFAMGPSIRKGVSLPAFQNVEYMNLWLNLLGLPEDTPNNGTLGIMDGILANPPVRQTPFYNPLKECSAVRLSGISGCHSCSSDELETIRRRILCTSPPPFPFQIASSTSRCYQNYCRKLVISGIRKEDPVAVAEQLVGSQTNGQSSCIFTNQKYELCESERNASGVITKSLSAEESDFANISPIVVSWKSGFVNGTKLRNP
ncbi:hypothetical protein DICVIV_03668 [Dictyocaulus viviparus]|uniref:Uncharacterized protein n=1 Tax=Dictyocaulus viviparus TaxID=29172 RepID=A0A0D8Y0C6_DICVI|nr:hypothetical protein DICVIV_03668 [Dictyocaulus viviparus]